MHVHSFFSNKLNTLSTFNLISCHITVIFEFLFKNLYIAHSYAKTA